MRSQQCHDLDFPRYPEAFGSEIKVYLWCAIALGQVLARKKNSAATLKALVIWRYNGP